RQLVFGRVVSSKRRPASRTATLYPFSVKRRAAVLPPNPLPMMTTSTSLPAIPGLYWSDPRASAAAGAGAAHAELVAFPVGHDDPLAPVLGHPPVRNLGGAQVDQSGDLGLQVASVEVDVQVHAVLGRFGLLHPLQQEFWPVAT